MKKYIIALLLATITVCTTAPILANPLNYDVVYVRYAPWPEDGEQGDAIPFITQGEKPYKVTAGADLMLLKADGSEVVLVECETCTVMDPVISFDAKTVYYTLITDDTYGSSSFLHKIKLDEVVALEDGASGEMINITPPIRLTFDEGFDSYKYANNVDVEDDQGFVRGVSDLTPIPLADGRLLFTSNRAATTALFEFTGSYIRRSVQHLYVMDDHDGELNTAELSNMRMLDTGALSLVQHPMQLKDGRILFSTWQNVATREDYAMTSLFTIHPDGSNLQQFTEPHDRQKYLDHFITQLPNEDVVAGYYYPSYDFGFGVLHRFPIRHSSGIAYVRNSVNGSAREFDLKGTVNITPHTTPSDLPAPNRSGKYSMPSVAGDGGMLVAYSTGYVNFFGAACSAIEGVREYTCEGLKSGIHMIPNAMTSIIYDPSQLVLIKDDLAYNEIWPRAVLTYQEIYKVEKPLIIPNELVHTTNASALVGTSSMYARESAPSLSTTNIMGSPSSADPDPFTESTSRETHNGNWTKQGSDAGIYNDSEIYGVRIISTPAKPFTDPIRPTDDIYSDIQPLLVNTALDRVVANYGSAINERWEILGEFKLTHRGTIDAQGNPDTSWVAKIPADTPMLIQAIDANGMTLNSELTWRGLKAGENRTDCGGCHAHSIEKIDFATTQAGQGAPITGLVGVAVSDPIIQDGIWDLTKGRMPILTESGTTILNQKVLGVEFVRDVNPIIQDNCSSCHNGTIPLDLSAEPLQIYQNLAVEPAGQNVYRRPQISKYIRTPQARQSYLAWVVWGERLDGRTNETREGDLDYDSSHPALTLTDAEKRTFSRWIDLGSPIDFPDSTLPFLYTKDPALPILSKIFAPKIPAFADHFSVGIYDVHSDINWTTLTVTYYPVSNTSNVSTVTIDQVNDIDSEGVLHIDLGDINLFPTAEYVLKIEVQDMVGNSNYFSERLTKGSL